MKVKSFLDLIKMAKNHKFIIDYDSNENYLGDGIFNLGYDEILYTTKPFAKDSLKLLKNTVPKFKYIRIHNIFTGSKGDRKGKINAGCDPVFRSHQGELNYNWEKIDSVFDIIVNYGYIPYIEFGFMPDALSSGNIVNFRKINKKIPKNLIKSENKGKVLTIERYPPINYNEWKDLVCNIVNHFKERYGEENVTNKWCFELWNEPNSSTFWKGTREEFFKLYDFTVAGLYESFPAGNFKIGGPALSSTSYSFFGDFIDHCLNGMNYVTGKIGTKMDFLSYHIKGGWAWQKPKFKRMLKIISSYQAIVDRFLPHSFEVQITELDPLVGCDLGVDVHKRFNFRNTHYYASFIVRTAIFIEQLKQVYKFNITEVFSDNIHFADEHGKIFKGTRCLTTASFTENRENNQQKIYKNPPILKPVVKAYQMLNSLHRQVLSFEHLINGKKDEENYISDELSLIPTRNNNRILILCTFFKGTFKSNKFLKFNILIKNIGSFSQVVIQEYRINEHDNNVYNLWDEMGKPIIPEINLIEKFEESQDKLSLFSQKKKLINNKQCILSNKKIKAHETILFEIIFQK